MSRVSAVASGVDRHALRAARERAGLTQHQLARLVDVAGGERVSAWERGAAEPTPGVLSRAASELKVPIVDLIWFDGDVPDLRALRLRAGLDAVEVASAVGVSPKTYWRWESKGVVRRLADPVVETLAGQFGVTAGEVVAALDLLPSS